MPRGTWKNFGETRGGVGKSGVLEHKGGNIFETRKDGTMEEKLLWMARATNFKFGLNNFKGSIRTKAH